MAYGEATGRGFGAINLRMGLRGAMMRFLGTGEGVERGLGLELELLPTSISKAAFSLLLRSLSTSSTSSSCYKLGPINTHLSPFSHLLHLLDEVSLFLGDGG